MTFVWGASLQMMTEFKSLSLCPDALHWFTREDLVMRDSALETCSKGASALGELSIESRGYCEGF